MVGILIGLILVTTFATSTELQEAIIHKAITNNPDIAPLYNRAQVALWSWLLFGLFAAGLSKRQNYTCRLSYYGAKNIPVLYTYFWIVVYSYYCELKSAKHSQGQEMGEVPRSDFEMAMIEEEQK